MFLSFASVKVSPAADLSADLTNVVVMPSGLF